MYHALPSLQPWALLLAAAALSALLAGAASAQDKPMPTRTVRVSFASAGQFDACQRDVNLDATSNPGTVTLAPSQVVATDMGNKIKHVSILAGHSARKVLTLDKPEATRAEIYIFGNCPASPGTPGIAGTAGTPATLGSTNATLNGIPIEFKPYHQAYWSVAQVDGSLLEEGRNEIIFKAGANLAVDTEATSTGGSATSADGGKSWAPVAGEYLVHLRLYRRPSRGAITSGVIDLANPAGQDVICPQIDALEVRISELAETPPYTSIDLDARSGETPTPDDSWTGWTEAKHVKPQRFVQWRATLKTLNHGYTPTLKIVNVEAQTTTRVDPAAEGLKLDEFDNQHIIRSSYPFTFQAPSPKLEELRKRYKLDQVVAGGKTDFEKLVLLRNWVRHQWPHNDMGSGKRTWDALEILGAPPGEHGMCVHFGVTFTQCALALGFPARQVILQNHYVSEIWSNQYGKWVLMDVECVQKEGWDKYGTAYYVDSKSMIPMSGLELHRAVVTGHARDVIQMFAMADDAKSAFAVHERRYGPEEYANFRRFAYPPRNNYLDQLEPWEQFHGQDAYHSELYLWWADGAAPIALEYSGNTSRPGDINWTVNQAAVTLTAAGEPGLVLAALDTYTPNFKAFEYRINGGAWQRITGNGDNPDARQAGLEWRLKPGTNTLEVKPVNAFDREGITSKAVVEWKPVKHAPPPKDDFHLPI